MSKKVEPGVTIEFTKFNIRTDLSVNRQAVNIPSDNPEELLKKILDDPKKIVDGFGYGNLGYVISNIKINK